MTGRSVPEWIGKTPNTPAPPRVRLRVFEAHGGNCYLTGRKIMPGEAWELEHRIALTNGGENRESNLAPALKVAHRAKTDADLKIKSKLQRIAGKHTGAIRPKGFGKVCRKMDGSIGLTKRAQREQARGA